MRRTGSMVVQQDNHLHSLQSSVRQYQIVVRFSSNRLLPFGQSQQGWS
jgi:hypothetical protein